VHQQEVEEEPTHVLLHIQQASVAPMPTLPQAHQPLLTKHGRTLAHHLLVIILVRQDIVERSVLLPQVVEEMGVDEQVVLAMEFHIYKVMSDVMLINR